MNLSQFAEEGRSLLRITSHTDAEFDDFRALVLRWYVRGKSFASSIPELTIDWDGRAKWDLLADASAFGRLRELRSTLRQDLTRIERIVELKQDEADIQMPPTTEGEILAPRGRSVFVVHGRNELLRISMFNFLRSINLSPIEWSQAVDLTGQGSPYVGEVLDAAFEQAIAVVVILSPDETAHLLPKYSLGSHDVETKPGYQARPNVLFEAGMALGRNAERTILVEVGNLRAFSDVAGRHSIRLSNSVASRQALAQRLARAGCDVDLSGTDWHESGDFAII